MRKLLIAMATACFLLVSTTSTAQQATDGTVEVLKAAQPCAVINFDNMDADLLESTLKQYLEDNKISTGDKSKGVRVLKGVVWPELSPEKRDYYIKIDGKKGKSTMYLASSKGYTNFITKDADKEDFQRMIDFLTNFNKLATKYQLGLDVKAAQEEEKKAEKTYNGSVKDGEDLAQELENIKKKIEENKAEQAKKQAALEEAKKKLAELEARYK
ncbi:MAG: hypothetical protein RL660_1079 [Bacteroidota bacterium]|jgi:hypothetical protein